jgi:hypothetical protein
VQIEALADASDHSAGIEERQTSMKARDEGATIMTEKKWVEEMIADIEKFRATAKTITKAKTPKTTTRKQRGKRDQFGDRKNRGITGLRIPTATASVATNRASQNGRAMRKTC